MFAWIKSLLPFPKKGKEEEVKTKTTPRGPGCGEKHFPPRGW